MRANLVLMGAHEPSARYVRYIQPCHWREAKSHSWDAHHGAEVVYFIRRGSALVFSRAHPRDRGIGPKLLPSGRRSINRRFCPPSRLMRTERNATVQVGRESWSDAMRERVSVALQQQPFGQASNTSSSRALSPRRRSASAVASASTGAGATNTTTRGLHYSEGVRGRRGEGEMAPFGAGGGRRAPDVSTLRRNAEERERVSERGVPHG